MVILSKFAENLDNLIFDHNISQKELAEKTGLDKASISRYRKGNCMPNLKSVVKLAEYFNCSIDFLIGKSVTEKHGDFLPCPPFSERLQFYVNNYEGTSYKLCKTVHLPDNRFYDWLKGTRFPTIDNVEKLADYFHCTIDCFLGREN
ncbi:MAG TPA: hypothetical protein DD415_04660 [Clostridiales bacterium]|nr:hypothetical protein [Clostridiales bacterium]